MALDPLLSLPNDERSFPLSFTPDFEIVQVNSNGLVVRCSRSFEWGATLQLGVLLHIQVPMAQLTELANSPPSPNNSFLDVKGIVVDCHKVLSYPAAKPQFEITLYYDSVTEDQCAALLQAMGQQADGDPSPTAHIRSFDQPEGFDRVCSLN